MIVSTARRAHTVHCWSSCSYIQRIRCAFSRYALYMYIYISM